VGSKESSEQSPQVDFADAVTIFEDQFAVTIHDDEPDEQGFVTIGIDASARVLVVVYTWREHNIRLISARKAGAEDRRQYEEGL
jgi:uncharacterized DUF497 family protein